MMKRLQLRRHDRALVFRDGELRSVLGPGKHLVMGFGLTVDVIDIRALRLEHDALDEIARSQVLNGHASVVTVQDHERGLVWRDGALELTLEVGQHVIWTGWGEVNVETLDMRAVTLTHRRVDTILRSGLLADQLETLELADHEAALVWRCGRIAQVLGAGTHAVWTGLDPVTIDRVDRREGRLQARNLNAIVENDAHGACLLDAHLICDGYVGALFRDGQLTELVEPGFHVFWNGPVRWTVTPVDVRERTTDVGGQDIITRDKVTLRLNAVVTWRVGDVRAALQTAADIDQALYRETQLALRAVVGTRDLEPLLEEKVAVTDELLAAVRGRATELGLVVIGVGIRDIILPGDMRELLNRVTEARTAAEASVITRREETAAMRSQANTAKLFEQNPTLMRLKELEVMERIAAGATLNIFSGEAGVQDRLLKLI